MARRPGLHAGGLRFAVAGRDIVADAGLDVGPGETAAILGPSGCGKTTLLRLIAGLERPQAGELLFDGDSVADIPAHRRGFGMMFQDFALFPHLDVGQNVAFGLRGGGRSREARTARVTELLETVGLTGFERRRVESLSGGERQRVALARALAPEPRLLMLDEPLGSLDRGLRERLLIELKDVLGRLAIPAIYVTHDQFEAFAIADRLAVMRDGRFVREGTPEAVYQDPQTEFVARFLGFDNIVDGVSDGNVIETALGIWAAKSPPGPVRLLLRGEGVGVAESAGAGTICGTVAAVAFQGMVSRVEIVANGVTLSFGLPSGTALPEPGGTICLRVPNAQILDGNPGAAHE